MLASKIETNSLLKATYLLAFRGHRLHYRIRRPLFIAVGMIFYETSWVLTTA
ncbi:MAG: hypothetical protein AMXMBFR84_09550 [Candidatus Hydrogenedentota bacterium]